MYSVYIGVCRVYVGFYRFSLGFARCAHRDTGFAGYIRDMHGTKGWQACKFVKGSGLRGL